MKNKLSLAEMRPYVYRLHGPWLRHSPPLTPKQIRNDYRKHQATLAEQAAWIRQRQEECAASVLLRLRINERTK